MAGKHKQTSREEPPPAEAGRPPDEGRPAFDLADLEPERWYIVRCTASNGSTFDFRDQYRHGDSRTLHFKSHTINTQVTRVEEVTPV